MFWELASSGGLIAAGVVRNQERLVHQAQDSAQIGCMEFCGTFLFGTGPKKAKGVRPAPDVERR